MKQDIASIAALARGWGRPSQLRW